MNGGKKLKQIEIDLYDRNHDKSLTIYVDVFDNHLARRWADALDHLLSKNYVLEKNYCFFGFADGPRNGRYILEQINASIDHINRSEIGYRIDDHFSMENTIHQGEIGTGLPGRRLRQEKFNRLHRYFEDLQGISGHISPYFQNASAETRWHIRQLNLLCHEFESWVLSWRKSVQAPDWVRPSQLMCWLNAPRFCLEAEDFELFGIETINRPFGGVFVGVNKAVGKHHWEVFNDEGRDSRVGELVTSTLRSQTEAAGDFDIEWGRDPGEFEWQKKTLEDFRSWLINNGFDPDDKSLTIGHPQIGQVDLKKSFGTDSPKEIWSTLHEYLDVIEIRTPDARARYEYHWSDDDFINLQVQSISKG